MKGWMNALRRRVSPLPAISAESHRWQLAEADYAGSPLLVRLNVSARDWIGHKALPIRLGFAVPLNSPDQAGLPSPTENDELCEIEDVVRQEVESKTKGMHVLVLTTGRMREFVFYVAHGTDVAAIHQAVRARVKSHTVQCKAVEDSAWAVYSQFAGS
jgi:hypothetical protein